MKKILLALMLCYSFVFSQIDSGSGSCPYSRVKDNGWINYKTGIFSVSVIDDVSTSNIVSSTFNFYYTNNTNYCREVVLLNSVPNPNDVNGLVPYINTLQYTSYSYYQVAPGTTIPPEPPTCDPITQDLVNNQCVCKDGYNDDETVGTCKPDIDCPPSMVYEITPAWHGYWIQDKRCVPDSNITEVDCLAISGAVYGSKFNVFGQGCYDSSYVKNMMVNDSFNDIIGFMPFSPLWNSGNDLVVQSLNKLFGTAKNGFNVIKNKFNDLWSTDKTASLQTHMPDIIDMEIGSDGVAYVVNLTPKTPPKNPTTDVDGWRETYDKFRSNGWNFPENPSSYDPIIHDPVPPTVNTPKFPIVSTAISDNLYQGGDAVVFNDSMLATAKITESAVVPDLAPLETSPIGAQVQTTIDLNSRLVGSQIKSYPTNLVKTSEVTLADRVESSYTGSTLYPDGSSTKFTITRTKFNVDGHTIDTVNTETTIPTKTTNKTFNTSFQTFKDGNGVVTNTVNNPTSVTTTTTSGTTTTTNVPTNAVATSSTPSAVDLTPVVEKLNSIDSKLNSLFELPAESYKPSNASEVEKALSDFKSVFDNYSLSLDSAYNYLLGLKTSLSDLTDTFNDAKSIFENKPLMSVANGTCAFQASFFQGQIITVDPCMFVSPYRPIITIFLTIYFTFFVFGFAFKYMFNIVPRS